MSHSIKDYTMVKNLIRDFGGDLPLVFIVGDEANRGDYTYVFPNGVNAYIGNILNCDNCDYVYSDTIYTDDEQLESDVRDILYNDYSDLSEEEFDTLVDDKIRELDDYWVKCIIVMVD